MRRRVRSRLNRQRDVAADHVARRACPDPLTARLRGIRTATDVSAFIPAPGCVRYSRFTCVAQVPGPCLSLGCVLNEEVGCGNLEVTYVGELATSAGLAASSGTWAFYFQDAIGSTRGLWDNNGERIGKYEYTPFGGKLAENGVEITRKFTGHDWDNDARLYYTAYRYYSPDSNRWLTRDPLGMVDGPNVYTYV